MRPAWTGTALAVIVAAYLLLAGAYGVRTPAWQTPDEPAHYNYIAQLAADGCCPLIAPGDWDQAYLSELTSSRFDPARLDRLPAVQYEDHQPPLYYGLAALVYPVVGGNLTALRLLSVGIGLGIVIAAFGIGRLIAPARPAFALLAAGIVAFVPQHMAVIASVNNDALAFALVGAAYVLIVVYVLRGVPPWALGLVVGLTALTKLSAIFLFGLAPLAILLTGLWGRRAGQGIGGLVRHLAAFFIPALGLGAIWWVRNLAVYGALDLFGLAAHDVVVVGQLRTADHLAAIGGAAYIRDLLTTTFNSFWGQFGWMAAPLPPLVYTLIGGGVGLAGLGAGVRGWAGRKTGITDDHTPAIRIVWALFGVALVVGFAQYGYYNTSFVQFQGRYLFPALIPFALMLAWGWEGLAQRVPGAAAQLIVMAVPLIGLVVLNGWVIWRVLPGLAP